MAVKKRSSGSTPLIIEQHPSDYTGYPFITLIQFRQQHMLTIVDNYIDKMVKAYVLDYCAASEVSEPTIIGVANEWYNNSRELYPLSIEFSKRGLSAEVSRLYYTFDSEFISRVIGPLPHFSMNEPIKIKKRRRKQLPYCVNEYGNVIPLQIAKPLKKSK